jgi:hypothetical protein
MNNPGTINLLLMIERMTAVYQRQAIYTRRVDGSDTIPASTLAFPAGYVYICTS